MDTMADDNVLSIPEIEQLMSEFKNSMGNGVALEPRMWVIIGQSARYILIKWWKEAIAVRKDRRQAVELFRARYARDRQRLQTSLIAMIGMLEALGDGQFDAWAKKTLDNLN